MRLYLPATLRELSLADLGPRVASALTPELMRQLPDEDQDGWEMSAFLTAADASLLLIGASDDVPRRVVLAVEIANPLLSPLAESAADLADLPSVIGTIDGVPWSAVVSIHVDDASAEDLVRAALAGDDEAYEQLGDVDLLWFDPTERAALAHGSAAPQSARLPRPPTRRPAGPFQERRVRRRERASWWRSLSLRPVLVRPQGR